MLIQVDVDSTLYDANVLFAEVAKEHFGIELPLDAGNWYDYNDVADTLTLHRIFRKSHSREYVEKQIPFEGAADCLKFCREKGHEVVFISDRHAQARNTLLKWLKDNNFTEHEGFGTNAQVIAGLDKRTWMKKHMPDVVIDDRVRTMFLARSWNAHVFALECPWNVNLKREIEGIHICKNWTEIASKLDKII